MNPLAPTPIDVVMPILVVVAVGLVAWALNLWLKRRAARRAAMD
jgi:uncharacterized membrane-anchored protein